MNWKSITKYLVILFWLLVVSVAILGIAKVYELRTDQVQTSLEGYAHAL